MKRANHLIKEIADPDNLRLAFWKACKGKNQSIRVVEYQHTLQTNLSRLRMEILSGEVTIGDYHYFTIFDPKQRLICAAAFSEQVLQHALMNICHKHFEKKQIFDSYASRPNKGSHAALKRAKFYCRNKSWFLKLDVQKFFASIHHDCLKNQIQHVYKDNTLIHIFNEIIDSYQDNTDRGVPIGNLTSQYFANHYLTGLDRFIKEKLRCKSYVRYMDDMVLWHNDKSWLKRAHIAVQEFIKTQLQCNLKPELLNRTQQGLPFLGYRLFPFHIRLTQRSKKRFIKKMQILDLMYESGTWSEDVCQRRALPLISFTDFADSLAFRKKVLKIGSASSGQ